tara:strand:+ start:803 stop:1231 length:429 start_codon:yes stop_codon:yes gene_type:complete
MSDKEYLESRVDDQIAWYNKKSSINKKYHLRLKALIIIFSSLIPFATGYNSIDRPWVDYIIATLGVLIAVFTGLTTLYKFQDKWSNYRMTGEALLHEKYLFQTNSGSYASHKEPFKLFVFRIENIINTEIASWSEYVGGKEE